MFIQFGTYTNTSLHQKGCRLNSSSVSSPLQPAVVVNEARRPRKTLAEAGYGQGRVASEAGVQVRGLGIPGEGDGGLPMRGRLSNETDVRGEVGGVFRKFTW